MASGTRKSARSHSWLPLSDRESRPRWLNSLAFVLLLAVFAAAPFPYGAITPLSVVILTAAAFLIAGLTFLTNSPTGRFGGAVIALTSLILIAVIGLIQLLPMSLPTLDRVAPVSASVYRGANTVLQLFHRPPVTPRISLAPSATASTLLLDFAYVALLGAAIVLFSTRSRRRIGVAVLLLSSTIHVFYAIATIGSQDRLHGTFVNPDHFAGYLQIALAFAFGLAWRERLYLAERGAEIQDLGGRIEKRAIAIVPPVLLWGIFAGAIGLTQSRGGILAAVLTTGILVLLAPLKRRRSTAMRAVVPAFLIVAAGLLFVVVSIGSVPLLRFFATDPRDLRTDTRTDIWISSIHAWQHSPLLGTGLGTFREAFRRTQTAAVEGLVEQAHDDFLQMLVTGGWVGAALIAIAFGSFLLLLFKTWLRQQHREEAAFALAGIGALIGLILHGLVEFNMSLPGIPATLAIALGLAWSAAREDPQRELKLA